MSRAIAAAAVAFAGLLAGGAGMAHAQSAPALRGTLADLPQAPEPAVPGPAATRLTVAPEEPEPPPHRRRAAADPYAPLGVDTGGLTLYPAITVGGVYTSNVATSGHDAQPDAGLQLRPSLRIESDWVRHAWSASAEGNLIQYLDHTDLDAQGVNAASRLRLDVRRNTTAVVSASYVLDQAGIADSGVPATAKGLRTEHTLKGDVALTQDFARFSTTLTAGATGRIFEDVKLKGGGREHNRDRDYVEPSLSLRASYTDPPALQPYVEASYTSRVHALSRDRYGLRRDSQGLGLTTGVAIEGDALWSGEAGLTYLYRNYDDPLLSSVSAFGLTGRLTWNPTEITQVVMAAGTSINEVSSASRSADPVWTGSMALTHGLRDNVDLLAGAGVEVEDLGPARDVTYNANVGLSWKLNPALSWSAGYDFTWLDSGISGRSYVEHRVSAGLTYSP